MLYRCGAQSIGDGWACGGGTELRPRSLAPVLSGLQHTCPCTEEGAWVSVLWMPGWTWCGGWTATCFPSDVRIGLEGERKC